MNRSDFQKLASIRIKEARALLSAKFYNGAFYLAGYAVECALKACIAKKTRKYDFPPKQEFVRKIYTHNLSELLEQAGLRQELEKEMDNNPDLQKNWTYVSKWSEESRYEIKTEKDAKDLYSALTQQRVGVFQWLRKRW